MESVTGSGGQEFRFRFWLAGIGRKVLLESFKDDGDDEAEAGISDVRFFHFAALEGPCGVAKGNFDGSYVLRLQRGKQIEVGSAAEPVGQVLEQAPEFGGFVNLSIGETEVFAGVEDGVDVEAEVREVSDG
jgi:hypothetical protein